MSKIEFIKNEFEKSFTFIPSNTEGILMHKDYGGYRTNNRSFVYTLIKILKPNTVLDIGSWHYDGTTVMAKALDDLYGTDYSRGNIISLDIRKGGYDGCHYEAIARTLNKRISPNFWLPHHTSLDHFKYEEGKCVHPEFKTMTNEQIFEKNKELLYSIGPKTYDLIFIDGDHSYEGAQFDWNYSCFLSHPGTVIGFDDIWDDRMGAVRKFFDTLNTEKYDFKDWNDRKKEENFVINNGVALPIL